MLSEAARDRGRQKDEGDGGKEEGRAGGKEGAALLKKKERFLVKRSFILQTPLGLSGTEQGFSSYFKWSQAKHDIWVFSSLLVNSLKQYREPFIFRFKSMQTIYQKMQFAIYNALEKI